jgi:hypothetical protein
VPLPPLTPEQRAAALVKAADARRTRAELKAKLKSGGLRLSEVLERAESDEAVGKMRVTDVLAAMPGLGKVRAERVMQSLGIATSRRLRGLGQHQRAALVREFEGR